jgi:broad specificity phosphatase PhoE
MLLTFIRHGKTDWGVAKRMTGWEDPELNNLGRERCLEMLPLLQREFDVIYTSPLKRASQTAEIFGGHLRIPVVADPDLRERNYGTLAGKTWEQVLQEYGDDMRKKDVRQEYDYRPFDGESAEQVRERVVRFLETVRGTEYRNPLVVSHSGIIRLMHALTKQAPPEHTDYSTLYTFEI